MDTDNGSLGGGDILKYIGSDSKTPNSKYLDNSLIGQFTALPYIQILIVGLLLVIMTIVILKLFNIKSIFKGKGIDLELSNIEKIKKHDRSILRANNFIQKITKFIENTPFYISKNSVEYLDYNLRRANIRIPGKSRVMKATEFNAVTKYVTLVLVALSLFVAILINAMVGMVMLLAFVMFSCFLPMTIVRQIVKNKDLEIQLNFADYYLMLHYVLIAGANTPLSKIMKSYEKTTSSIEMHRLVDVCIHYIDTYGEYEGTRYISKEYREVPEIGKLMRLIRQANEGGNIEQELMGFRAELIANNRYVTKRRKDKQVSRARRSFNILIIILVQAIISAMSIYMSDFSMTGSILGG